MLKYRNIDANTVSTQEEQREQYQQSISCGSGAPCVTIPEVFRHSIKLCHLHFGSTQSPVGMGIKNKFQMRTVSKLPKLLVLI